jgi:hypothetical protein
MSERINLLVDSLYAKDAVKTRAALSASSFELISILGDIFRCKALKPLPFSVLFNSFRKAASFNVIQNTVWK